MRQEIAEACRREADLFKLEGQDPASVQPVEVADARLLARPILQEYDAVTVEELVVNPANQFGNLTDSGFGNMQAAQPCGNRRSEAERSGEIRQLSRLVFSSCILAATARKCQIDFVPIINGI